MKKFFTPALLLVTVFTYGQIAINQTGEGPVASSILDVKSTTKGLLVPRMTTQQKNLIQTPANGLLIYQIDSTTGFYFNAGTTAVPRWLLLSAQSLANGTTAGQVYLTGNAPYAPAAPQTVTGDISLSASAVATIAASAVTTAKVADGAITSSKMAGSAVGTGQLANNSVSVAKISAGGTPSAATYLRGDGAWAAPASATGIALIATQATVQTIVPGGASSTPSTVTFDNVQSSNSSLGTFTGSNTFNVNSAGIYLITANVASTSNFVLAPVIYVNGAPAAYGTGISNSFFPAPTSRSAITAVLNLSEANTIQVRVSPATQTTSVPLTGDGSTKITITKL